MEHIRSCDSDCVAVKAGELIIRIPKDVYGIPGLWGSTVMTCAFKFTTELKHLFFQRRSL